MSGKKNIFIALSEKYKTPAQVQTFLRTLPYNLEKEGKTLRSATGAIGQGVVHCFEAAFIAAAILEQKGFPPLVLSFESIDSLGHVLFVFKKNHRWGAIGRSCLEGLNGRPPIFRSIRDLVWSYYEPYVDETGKITEYLLANLDESNTNWRFSKKNVWKAETYLIGLKHIPLKSSKGRFRKIAADFRKYGHPVKKKYWR
jgi:hypothetical protein